jgi:hypothetical protein
MNPLLASAAADSATQSSVPLRSLEIDAQRYFTILVSLDRQIPICRAWKKNRSHGQRAGFVVRPECSNDTLRRGVVLNH